MDCSTSGFPVPCYLQEFAQLHVHWVSGAIQPSHPFHDDWKWRENFSGYRRSNEGTFSFIRRKIVLGAGTKSVWRFSEPLETPLLFTEPLSIPSQSWEQLGYHRIVRLKRIMKGIKAKTGEPLYLTPPQPLQWGLTQGHPAFHQYFSRLKPAAPWKDLPLNFPLTFSGYTSYSFLSTLNLTSDLSEYWASIPIALCTPWNTFYFDNSGNSGHLKTDKDLYQ